MKSGTDAKRKSELARFKKTATSLSKKAASIDRARSNLEKSLEKWARKNRIRSLALRAKAPTRGGKPCKPIIDHPTGPYICILISSGPGICRYRCYRI